jgi:hypothetical protein
MLQLLGVLPPVMTAGLVGRRKLRRIIKLNLQFKIMRVLPKLSSLTLDWRLCPTQPVGSLTQAVALSC